MLKQAKVQNLAWKRQVELNLLKEGRPDQTQTILSLSRSLVAATETCKKRSEANKQALETLKKQRALIEKQAKEINNLKLSY